MDNINTHTTSSPELMKLELDNLRAIKVLGKGALGTVFLVHDTSNDPNATSPFALKVVEKSSLLHDNRRARWEISVLSRLKTQPFLPILLGSIETQEILGWATPYCPGSDLNVLRYRQPDHVFSTSVIRFYIAEIVCAIEQLHEMGIAYRDLKPENILIQQSGHLTLTDFDLSRTLPQRDQSVREVHAPPLCNNNHPRKIKSARVSPVNRRSPSFTSDERSYSFVGTEEYIAPEIIRGEGHEFAVDWWALGVLCYEMLYGTTPFKGKNKKETFQKILMMPPVFHGKPNGLTDLIGKLLEKDPTRRLGYSRGACEIKEHEFFKGLKWDMLTEVVRPPNIPLRDETDLTEELNKIKGGIDIREYFAKLRAPPSPLWSPSLDERGTYSIELTEF